MSSTSFSVSARMRFPLPGGFNDCPAAAQPGFSRNRPRDSLNAWEDVIMPIPLIAAACLLAWPAGLHAQSMDALYEKAKAEGEFVIYGGGPTSLYEVPANAFKQKYPGIKVTIHAGFSNVHNSKINEMIKAKANDADLAILQTVSDFYQWKKEGVLAQYRPEGSEFIDQTSRIPTAISPASSSPRWPTPTTRNW